MALTRPRYSQIPDSDYKNSCRIVTTTNVTLTSGAPSTYDGVALVQYDRILVTGQSDATQNGIYSVSTVGSGSNGTWVRSKDANTNDRLTAGMNTFIEEGTYSGQFWHLLTPNPIVLGVTELVFGQITGNAAGTSSQVQFNSAGSIAGAANLRYDSATGNVVIGGGTVSTSNITGALVVNGGIGVTGEIWAQGNIYSVGSRVLTAYDLQTITFTANYISKDPANVAVPVVGTGTIYGTHNFGNLQAISTYGDYNTTAQSGYYSVNDASGAPAFIVYVGFTGVTSFNRAVYNINYTASSGHIINIDLYNYDTDAWDTFATYSGSGSWQSFALGVINDMPYIDYTGNVTTRIYHVSSGNTAHRTWIDYVALEQSITGGQGPRGATGPTGPSGTYSGGYISGVIITGNNITTSGNIVSNSGNISVSTTTGALVITGDGGIGVGGNIFAGGNITANSIYTVNGLFWQGNGLAFSSGLEVSEINTANALSNISTQVTSIRFDKDTGFNVTELNPGNIKVSLGSSFKTWHVPGQSDLVAVAEDEVTFFGNGIDITTHPTAPKSLTFIANNSVLEANIGAYQLYANANAAAQQVEINSLASGANTNTAAYLTTYTGNISAGNINVTSNLYIQNVNILSNIASQSAYLDETVFTFTSLINDLEANGASQSTSLDAIAANLTEFKLYANSKIGTNNNSNLVITSTAESVSAITGALTVAGGVGIGGNLYVAGNIFASNLISINSTTLQVQDPLLYLNADSPYPYNYDIGFYSHFVGGPGVDHYQHTGLARDYTTNIWNFFSNIRTEPGVTIDWSNVEIVYDTVRAGDIIVANTTESTSTTTGALRVAGGAGIAGALYITNTGDVSANIGTLLTNFNTLDANIGSYQLDTTETLTQLDAAIVNYSTYANIYLGTATTFTITNSGSSEYVINGENNPALYLIRGQKYNFSVDATGHPFWIKTSPAIGTGDQYNTGVTNNGTAVGIVKFEVPLTAPAVLYYVSQFDAAMTNELRIVNFSTLEANIGTLYLGNISTQANLGAFQAYANTGIATLDANIGTLFLGNVSTQANLGAFQTYANTTFTTYSNANVAAYLPIYTGNIGAGNIEVTGKTVADTFYTTNGIYWSGNGNPYSAGGSGGITYTASATAPGSPTKGDQWFDTTDGTLYEYMDDGDSFQWVDIQTPTFASNAVITSLSGNVSTDGNISASSIIISSGIFWTNGVAFVSSVYSNVNVEAYIGGNVGTLYLGNISTQANLGTLYLGNISTQANLGAFQTFSNSNAATQATSINTINANLGAFQSYANTKIGTNNNSNLVIDATTVSSSLTTGALVVKGGVGIAGNIYANGNVFLGGGANSNVVAAATTTSTSTTTGALVVRGGVGVAGNVYADRLYTTNGLYWSGNGVAFSSGGGGSPFASNIVITSGTATTNTTTGAIVVTGSGGLAVGGVGIFGGNLVAASTTSTSSVTTGALVVNGGVGIGGRLYVGSDVFLTTGFLQTLNAITSTSAGTGAITTQNGGGMGITGNLYVGNEFVVPGGGKITSTGLSYLLEKVTVTSGAPSGNVNIDLSTQSVMYWTGNATGNVSANIRGTATQPLNSLLAVGQSVTAVIFLPNGPSNFLVTNVYIDNTTVTPAYQGNAAPVLGNSNSMDIYSFTILKTASATYKVFASQTQFMHPG